MQRIVNKLKDRYTLSVLANVLSYVLIGGVGIAVNVIIVTRYGTHALGYFNQVFAFYVILSQVAVGGLHLSTQVFITSAMHDKTGRARILSTAIVLSLLFSLIVSLLLYVSRSIPAAMLNSEDISTGLILIIPGLIFFPINKVALAYLNGKRHMFSMAFFLALRSAAVLLFMALLVIGDYDAIYTPAILSLGEILLAACMLWYIRDTLRGMLYLRSSMDWFRKHFHHGWQAMIGNLMLAINARTDILVLGIFANDAVVGIYSFAANIAEGFNQIPYVLRNAINPVITLCYVRKNMHLLRRILVRARNLYYKLMIPFAALVVAGYAAVLYILDLQDDLRGSKGALAILMAGLALSSGYMPFQLIFNQTGFPATQSYLLVVLSILSAILNFALVPFMGMYGSALGTALALVLHIVLLRKLVKKKLGIEI